MINYKGRWILGKRSFTVPFHFAEDKCISCGFASARMAACLGAYGSSAFGGDDLPQPGAVIMQYTGHNEYTEYDLPTYARVGENDGIASWRVMESWLNALSALFSFKLVCV